MSAQPQTELVLAEDSRTLSTIPLPTVPVPAAASASPIAMMQMAIERGYDIEKIEKLMQLQREWRADQANNAFTEAMARFKQNPPEILKRKRVIFESNNGTVDYMHAELADVCEAAIKGLADVGISHRWDILEQTPNLIKVACVLTHAMGHSQSTVLSGPPDTSGKKNAIQCVASTVTYLQRYTLLAATGLATKGMDDDGRGGADQGDQNLIGPGQVADLEALIQEVGADRNKFLVYCRVEKIEHIKVDDYRAVVTALRAKAQASTVTKKAG
jgi:hypothetical protein